MNTNDRDAAPQPGDDPLPDALRWRLRALREDVAPPRDLWAGIAPRLQPRVLPRPQPVRTPWLALAASLLLVVGMAGLWQGRLQEADAGQAALVEARRLSTDYRAALQAMPDDARQPHVLAPALNELDRSAAQIRRALARDPDSRLLLEQLRRTYSRRLELSQRALAG